MFEQQLREPHSNMTKKKEKKTVNGCLLKECGCRAKFNGGNVVAKQRDKKRRRKEPNNP